MTIAARGQNLKSLVDTYGAEWACQRIQEAFELPKNDPDRLRSEDFSLKEMALAFCGRNWFDRLSPEKSGGYQGVYTEDSQRGGVQLREAGEAVDISAFSNITGQIIFNRILDAWKLATDDIETLYETIPTDLDGEKMPFISRPLTEGDEVKIGMPYQEAGLSEEYITTPRLGTFGKILSLHKLTIFYDRTGQMLRQADKLGEQIAMNKKRRLLNMLLGTTGSAPFSWKGVSYSPYQTAGTYWTNDVVGRPLVDWVDIEFLEILATKVLDPDLQNVGVSSPIGIELDSMMTMPAKFRTAQRIIHATEIRGVDQATAPNIVTIGPNVMAGQFSVIRSSILFQQAIAAAPAGLGMSAAAANDMWWMWDSKRRGLAYMQAWPLHVIQAPPNSIKEFEQDIVWRCRADERGNPAWIDPRYVFRVRNLAA